VGSLVALVWWGVAKLTGRGKPPVRVWAQRFQQQAQEGMRRSKGEVVDAEVRELP
jgi:hypothetical protein